MMIKAITIVGGGLAGLTLGIALRQRDVPVVVYEAGRYPRHRVCGELISGRGQEVLRKLGLDKKIFEAGAREAKTAGFFTAQASSKISILPESAWCISRYVLDDLLAKEFIRLGGELKEQIRFQGQFEEGVVRATGRRTKAVEKGWRWFGLKVHARQMAMAADLEVHLQPHGYVGLCRLANDETDVCGLFRSRAAVPDLGRTWRDWLQGAPGSILHERLVKSAFVEDSFCSVSGLSLAPHKAAAWEECSVGDAVTMIAPVTGNGMSMAFESAGLAVEPLTDYSHGEIDWTEAWKEIAQQCDRRFARRLRWGSWLQWVVFRPELAGPIVRTGLRVPGLWNTLITRTR